MDQAADDLELCRLVARMYTQFQVSQDFGCLTAVSDTEVIKRYSLLECDIKEAFEKKGVVMDLSLVDSQFGSEFGYRLQVSFKDIHSKLHIPDDAIAALCSYTLCPHDVEPQILRFGFLGRTLEDDGRRYITDGLRSMEQNEIYIDYPTHAISTHDELLHRLTHELLHACGIDELSMREWIYPAIMACRSTLDEFVDVVHGALLNSYPSFLSRIKQTAEDNRDLVVSLRALADDLYNAKLFPMPASEVMYAEMYAPKNLKPNVAPVIGSNEVLFL